MKGRRLVGRWQSLVCRVLAARNRWYDRGGRQPVEPTEPKLPSEAIELYNNFIHGEISRRAFMEGVQRLAGGLAAAAVINALMPNYAVGQQVPAPMTGSRPLTRPCPPRRATEASRDISCGLSAPTPALRR